MAFTTISLSATLLGGQGQFGIFIYSPEQAIGWLFKFYIEENYRKSGMSTGIANVEDIPSSELSNFIRIIEPIAANEGLLNVGEVENYIRINDILLFSRVHLRFQKWKHAAGYVNYGAGLATLVSPGIINSNSIGTPVVTSYIPHAHQVNNNGQFSMTLPEGYTIRSAHEVDVSNLIQTPCQHEFINVGFQHVTMACKHCGVDK